MKGPTGSGRRGAEQPVPKILPRARRGEAFAPQPNRPFVRDLTSRRKAGPATLGTSSDAGPRLGVRVEARCRIPVPNSSPLRTAPEKLGSRPPELCQTCDSRYRQRDEGRKARTALLTSLKAAPRRADQLLLPLRTAKRLQCVSSVSKILKPAQQSKHRQL